jgi:hypothetical protein
LRIRVPKSSELKFHDLKNNDNLEIIKRGSSVDLFYSFDIFKLDLLELSILSLLQIHEMVVSSGLVPKPEEKSETEQVQINQVPIGDEITISQTAVESVTIE